MSEQRHSFPPQGDRAPFDALRAWEPAPEAAARERARRRLELHMADPHGAPVQRSRHAFSRAPRRPRGAHRGSQRWLGPLVALAVVAGGGGALAAVLLRTEHTARLAVFTAHGTLAPEFHVAARGDGYCWTASLAAQTPHAYRCFEGNMILDPCFASSAHAHSVACFISPWRPVTILTLTRRLPRTAPLPPGPQLPWAILTADGRHCVYMTGATAPVGGERINYGCTGGSFLVGNPDTRQPLWRIRSVKRFTPAEMREPISRFPLVAIKQTIG
ncbi:MAG: hypothetical protein ACP5H2_09365 [Solirubrobacteraceae bacterium]